MTVSIGEDRELYRPLDQKGNYTQGAIGCHRGHMECLNVPNGQPGFRYWWARTDPGSLRRTLRRGWEVVKLTDPERRGEEKFQDLAAAGLDSTFTRNDIVLCRMPESRYREWSEQLNRLAENTGGDTSPEYLERGRSLQEATANAEPLYFKSAGHGYRHTEHNK